jgi:hypothetical protein
MKKTPQMQKLEELLRSGKLVAGGFMANDDRSLEEVIAADTKVIQKAGLTNKQVAEKMQEITALAAPRLGQWVKIDENLSASVEDFRGGIVCPWPHAGTFTKRITWVKTKDTERLFFWTDLNTHLIEEHNFYEGKGSSFRIEPADIIEILFE